MATMTGEKKTSRSPSVPTVPYTMNLPDGRTLFVRVPEHMTGRDRDGSLTFKPEGVKLLDRLRVLAVDTPASPSPGYILTLREALKMTQADFARQLDKSTVTVKKWEAGSLKPGKEAVKALQKLSKRCGRRGVVLDG